MNTQLLHVKIFSIKKEDIYFEFFSLSFNQTALVQQLYRANYMDQIFDYGFKQEW